MRYQGWSGRWRYQEYKDREEMEIQKEQQAVRMSRASNTSRGQLESMEWKKALQTVVRAIVGVVGSAIMTECEGKMEIGSKYGTF